MVLLLGVCLLLFFLVHRCISKELFMDWCKVPYLVMPSVLVLKYMNRNGFLYRFVCWGASFLWSHIWQIYTCVVQLVTSQKGRDGMIMGVMQNTSLS